MKLLSFIALLFFASSAICEVNSDLLFRDNLQSYLNLCEDGLMAMHSDPENKRKIKNKFDEFNREVNFRYTFKDLLECKYCELVKTCGNRICEPDKLEDENNCYEDCAPGLIRSYNKQTICSETSKVYYPKNTKQGRKIIRRAIKNNDRVKVVGTLHSDTNIICTDGVTISTAKMNKIFGLEKVGGVETVRAQSGTTIYELLEWLHHKNRSVGYAVLGFRHISIGGIIGTGAHGTAVNETSTLSDYVESFKIIKGDGNIAEYFKGKTPPHIWNSLTANLGLLGFITEMRIRVKENYKMEVNVSYGPDYKLLYFGGVQKLMEDCDWAQFQWFPNSRGYIKHCGNKTDKAVEPGAQNILIGDRTSEEFQQLGVQIFQSSYKIPWVGILMENLRYFTYLLSPPYAKYDKDKNLVNSANLVGNSYRLLASEFASEQSKTLLSKDFELTFSEPHIKEALRASKRYFRRFKVSFPFIGLFLRFGRITNDSFLSVSGSGKNFKHGDLAMFVDFHHYKPVGLSEDELKTYDKVYADYVRLMIKNHNARVHWGKNRGWAFKLIKDLGRREKELFYFQKAIDDLDPNGIFSNDFSEMMGFE